ncbi:hypothetical protein CASFOL_040058 [Castilleja foliolosa]|uniref:Uncharacterized protein n=1 Tax=Castilleja foliolosa TaxID=1961234 RepID=A0ABD3BES5_9LAMI
MPLSPLSALPTPTVGHGMPRGYRSSLPMKGKKQAPSRPVRSNGGNTMVLEPNVPERNKHEVSQCSPCMDVHPSSMARSTNLRKQLFRFGCIPNIRARGKQGTKPHFVITQEFIGGAMFGIIVAHRAG